MKYAVTVVLSIYQTIEVEADSLIKAEQIAWKLVDQNQILTDYARGEGYSPTECEIYDTREMPTAPEKLPEIGDLGSFRRQG